MMPWSRRQQNGDNTRDDGSGLRPRRVRFELTPDVIEFESTVDHNLDHAHNWRGFLVFIQEEFEDCCCASFLWKLSGWLMPHR
mmetsp:Transcript_47753/g.113474  ORF Transcript_47753/g.113474 Transcript_47753/m.113474 type:complete len:83 (+) Transcript_47753:102-350(+)